MDSHIRKSTRGIRGWKQWRIPTGRRVRGSVTHSRWDNRQKREKGVQRGLRSVKSVVGGFSSCMGPHRDKQSSAFPYQHLSRIISSQLPPVSTMATISPQPVEGHDEALSSLTTSIEALNLAEQNSSIQPVKTVFGSAGGLLARIRVRSPTCDDDLLTHAHLGRDR